MFLLCICSCLWVPFITQCYDVTSLVRHLYVCVVGKNFKKYQGTSLLYIDERQVYESRLCCKAACLRDDRCVGFYYRSGICFMSHTSEIVHIQQRDIGKSIMKSTAFESVIVYNISFITAPGKYDCISHVTLPICMWASHMLVIVLVLIWSSSPNPLSKSFVWRQGRSQFMDQSCYVWEDNHKSFLWYYWIKLLPCLVKIIISLGCNS